MSCRRKYSRHAPVVSSSVRLLSYTSASVMCLSARGTGECAMPRASCRSSGCVRVARTAAHAASKSGSASGRGPAAGLGACRRRVKKVETSMAHAGGIAR
jgi:hypothetical protein